MARYNGWTNYETWAVSFWLDNELDSYYWLRELVQGEGKDYDKAELAELLKERVSYDCNPLIDTATMYTDLLNEALSEVNWIEIIESAMED